MSLEIRDLAFAYDARPVFSQTNLTLGAGSYTCLLGPSGSGKSTLLYAVAGVVRPSAGSIAIGGRTVVDASTFVPPHERGLGMVFQDYALWPHMTALENVAFPLRARGGANADAAALRLLDRMGLEDLSRRRPDELSGGQKQRVALARALAASPALVLLDEPLSALDATVRLELRSYLAQFARELGVTALHVTHDPDEAFYLADTVGVMIDGRIVQVDTPQAIYRRPHDVRVARITGPASVVRVGAFALRDGFAELALGGRTIAVPAHPRLAPNLIAALILRPDALAVVEDERGDALPAVARDSRFAGEHYVVDAVLSDGTELTVTSRTPLHGRVSLSVDTQNAWLAPFGESTS
jgi:ABC-type Fe3+/spermidine/putrescine transport system ATPase subunit